MCEMSTIKTFLLVWNSDLSTKSNKLNSNLEIQIMPMQKPPTGSKEALSAKKLLETIKTRERWTNKEIFSVLFSKYPAYDRDGFDHKIRQILSYLVKVGKIKRIDRGM